MREPRAFQTATLLPGGNVLVVGGDSEISLGGLGFSKDLSTAEIFQSASGQWTPVGSMQLPRAQHSATLMPDGDVLVAGGFDCGGGNGCLGFGGSGNCCGASSAEVYDPATNIWTFTEPVTTGDENAAALLPEGSVLVVGGNFDPINTHELDTANVYATRYSPDEPITPAANSLPPETLTPLKIERLTESAHVWREKVTPDEQRISKRQRPPVGTVFQLTVNEPATLTFSFIKSTNGRRVRGVCVRLRKANSARRRCPLAFTAGTLRVQVHVGLNKISFDGLIAGGKRLASGTYTLTVMPTEPAQGSARSRLQFTIVSPASLLPRLLPK